MIVWGRYLITMDAERRILRDAGLVIRDDRIVDIGPVEDLRRINPNEEEYGGPQVCVLPGLVNTHMHLCCGVFRGYIDDMPLIEHDVRFLFPGQQHLSSDIVYATARLTCLELLRNGVTTTVDAYLQPNAAAQALADSGLRGIVSPAMMDRWLADEPGPVTKSTEACVAELDELHARWDGANNGRIRVWPAPFTELTASPRLLEISAERARAWNAGIQIHLAETMESVHLVKRQHGKRVLEYVESCDLLEGTRVVAAHCCWLSEPDIEVIKRNTVAVSYCPSSEMKMSDGIPPAARLRQVGVPVAIAIDATCVNNCADLFREAKLGAILQKVVYPFDPELIPAEQALEMITCVPAEALGMSDSVGSLEVGKKADAVTIRINRPHFVPLLDQPRPTVINHLIYSASGEDVCDVFVDGVHVVAQGRVLSIDEEEVMAAAQSATERLIADSGIDREVVPLRWSNGARGE